jgi:sarcosine oxidase subunit alpha
VTTKDLVIATQEGFVSIEHVKRYTTTGMATDQGKTSNLNALAIVAGLSGQPMDAIGLTKFRPPYTPVTFAAFAGPFRGTLYAPVRRPPIATPGAVLEDVGLWQRARCFPALGEAPAAAVARECLAVREAAGMLDASTLGKIEVVGPDAETFLNRLYPGDFTTLSRGRCRYAVLLGEDGFVRDDGIVARLANDRFHVTTTTGGAAFVLHHMEDYLQTEFSDLHVWLTSVTEQWAVVAVQGPRSAEYLAPFITDIDLAAMPHMSVRLGHIGGVPIRLFRVSFTGESGFEVNLPPAQAQRLWDALLQRGVTPYGTDAMHVLRAEKGFIMVGQETDGTVTLDDLGLAWTMARSKGDFIGRRSLALSDLCRPDRKQLVGLVPADPSVVLEEGAQVVLLGQTVSAGHVTSSYPRATQPSRVALASRQPAATSSRRGGSTKPASRGCTALALVTGGRSRIGQTLHVPMGGRAIAVSVIDPVVHDPLGTRLRPSSVAVAAALPLVPAVAPRVRHMLETTTVRIAALPPMTLLSVRGGDAAATGIGMALGVLLPTVPCRSVMARDRAALWLGPDEWLIQAPNTAGGLIDVAHKAAGEHPASVVEVSCGMLALEIAGPRAAWCLNAFCALDLDVWAFPAGMCTRTVLGKAEVVLWRITPEVFQVQTARSLFPHVWACLEAAWRSIADDPPALNEAAPMR